MTGSAVLSPDGVYRYVLERLFPPELDRNSGRVLFVMLNPSTADAFEDDRTIGRCIGYAKAWGFTELAVANLFAYRSVVPAKLYDITVKDPVGPDNDYWIAAEAKRADLIVCAWGSHGRLYDRDRAVMEILTASGSTVPYALGLTKDGQPRHPLYLPADLTPTAYGGAGRPDLDAELTLVACCHCGTVQENRTTLVFLGPIEPCGNCGHLYGRYA